MLVGVLAAVAACGDPGSSDASSGVSGQEGEGSSTSVLSSVPPAGSRSAPTETTAGTGGVASISDEDREFLFLAQEQLVAACMSERGFAYSPAAPPPADERPSARSGWITDMEQARAEGYGFAAITSGEEGDVNASGDDPSAAVDPNTAYLATLSNVEVAEWSEALDGSGATTTEEEGEAGEVVVVPTDGCAPQVEAAIYGDLAEWNAAQQVFEAIQREAFDRLESDERMVAARQGWISCMADRGFTYSDPEEPQTEALQAYYEGGDREAAQAREIEIATSDAECVAESKVADVYDELLEMFRSEAAARREADLLAVRDLETAAVERAKELLNDS